LRGGGGVDNLTGFGAGEEISGYRRQDTAD